MDRDLKALYVELHRVEAGREPRLREVRGLSPDDAVFFLNGCIARIEEELYGSRCITEARV